MYCFKHFLVLIFFHIPETIENSILNSFIYLLTEKLFTVNIQTFETRKRQVTSSYEHFTSITALYCKYEIRLLQLWVNNRFWNRFWKSSRQNSIGKGFICPFPSSNYFREKTKKWKKIIILYALWSFAFNNSILQTTPWKFPIYVSQATFL